jgi:hypothetical protein
MDDANCRATSLNERAIALGILKQSGRILNIGIVKNCKRKAASRTTAEKRRARQ